MQEEEAFGPHHHHHCTPPLPSPADGGWVNNRLSPMGQMGLSPSPRRRGESCWCRLARGRANKTSVPACKRFHEGFGSQSEFPQSARTRARQRPTRVSFLPQWHFCERGLMFQQGGWSGGGVVVGEESREEGGRPQGPLTKHSHQHITRDRLSAALLSQHRFEGKLLLASDLGLDLRDRLDCPSVISNEKGICATSPSG